MGRRGISQHVRGKHAATAFASLGVRCALLRVGRSWTSFAVLDDDELDGGRIATAMDAAVAQIQSDDDLGSGAQFYGPDGWSAQLFIDIDGSAPSDADDKLLAELVRRKIITADQRSKLRTKMRLGARTRAWLANDGLEKLLGLPDPTPLPAPCSAALLAGLAPDATVIAPARTRRASKPKPKSKPTPKPKRAPAAAPAAIDRKVLALHVHYWTEIFQMNGWKLYNRYRKHLPAERRREVDALCDLVVMGDSPRKIERAVEAILASVWTADDWAAAIRDPRLTADEPLGPEQLADWRRLLAY
jgi:hypothetical protein